MPSGNTYEFSTDDNRKLLIENDNCDKYDYLAAVACGALGGVIDVCLVGLPGDSVVGDKADQMTDQAVKLFAKRMGWKPKEKNADNVSSAIGFLERTFRVNYDQRKPGDVGGLFNIAPGTHHMMSLAHSPDIMGLFFSIVNQFYSTSSFIADGQLITIQTETYELQGGNFVTKVLCGIANWFGHLMSDVAGSSGAHGRGTGIVIPFYEIFGFCKFGSFKDRNGVKDLSEIAMQAFTQGYDFRFGLAAAVPVVITDLLIKFVWGLRRHFQYHYSIRECFPSSRHASLRVMLLMGNGTLCLIDAADAGIKSGGEPIVFFMRLNLIAWFRFALLVVKEVMIRVGISDFMENEIVAYQCVNEALCDYLAQLKEIDIERYREETEKYNELRLLVSRADTERDFNFMILNYYKANGLSQPWQGDFDTFMGDRSNRLMYE